MAQTIRVVQSDPVIKVSHTGVARGSGGGGVTDHGALTGLADNDHPQYQLTSQKAAASGYASLDAGTKVPVAQIPTGIPQANVSSLTADLALKAALASPTFTGTPAAPTAAVSTNTTQLATTAFVLGQRSVTAALALGTAAAGTSFRYSPEDHVHPTTGLTPLASPTFTGTPAAPTAAVDTNTTQLATTAFVLAQKAASVPVALGTAALGSGTRFSVHDHVHPTTGLITTGTADQTLTGRMITSASTTTRAGLNVPHGVAPTTPVNGDIWTTTAGTFVRINGSTVQLGTGTGVTDGDKVDITVSAAGATWTIDNDVVTYAKMQNVSAQNRILARKSAGAGDVEEATGAEIAAMLPLDSLPLAIPATVTWSGTWPARTTATAQSTRRVIFIGNPGGSAPTDMVVNDVWMQG